MKKYSILILVISFLRITVYSQSSFDDCTIGVASGSATEDGRPLAWKTRDWSGYSNIKLKYNTYHDYSFILISPSAFYPSTGLNEHGLVIFKSNTYDLTTAPSGPDDWAIQEYALGYCRTIDEFQEYMDSTNISGRSTTGNFALIDSTGAAAIFEVAGYEYWRFDAEDEPNGYIIRTNFTVNGGGNTGQSRYNRSSALISDFYAGDSLNYRTLLRYHMRDFSDYYSQPYPVPFLEQIYPSIPFGYFRAQYSICSDISTSSAVIQGILPGEKAVLSTLWAMLGQPAAAIAVPYWPVGETPQVSNSSPTAPLCDIAIEIKDLLFDLSGFPNWINSHLLRDTTGGGLWTCSFPNEDLIMDSAEVKLDHWRGLDSIPFTDMLAFENDMAEWAYNELSDCYNSITTDIKEPALEKNEFKLYPNPAYNAVSLVIESGIKVITIEILDMQGKMMMYQNPGNNDKSFDINHLPKGIYIVRLHTNKGVDTEKLIIQ